MLSKQDGWLLRARERHSIGAAESSDPRNGDGFSDAEGMAMNAEVGARRHSREVVWRPCYLAECDHNTVDVPREALLTCVSFASFVSERVEGGSTSCELPTVR